MLADDLPKGWTSARIGDCVQPRIKKGAPAADVPFTYIDISSIDNDEKRIVEPKRLNGGEAPSRARQHVHRGDVLVSMTRPNLNAVAQVDQELDGAIASTGFDVLRGTSVMPEWLFAMVTSSAFVSEMTELVQGALYPAVKSADVRSYEIPVPPLPEQRRIVARLDAIEAHRRSAKEKLDQLPDLLDRYRQSVLTAAFRGDLTAAWREAHPSTEPASALLDRIRAERRHRWIEDKAKKATDRAQARDAKKGVAWTDADRVARLATETAKAVKKYQAPEPVDAADLPDLPEGWSWIALGDLADVGTGATPKRGNPDYWEGGTVPWVTSGAVNADRVDEPTEYTTEAALAQTNLTLYPPGTLLVAMYGEGKTRGMCAELTIEATTNQALAAVALTGLAAPLKPWVRALLEKNYADIRQLSAGGVQPNLNLSMIRDIPIPIPPAAEMDVAASAVAEALSVHDRCYVLGSDAAKRVETLRQSTLARAFRGELVPTDAALARLGGPPAPAASGQERGEAQTRHSL